MVKINLPQEALIPTTDQNELFYGCHYAEAITALKALKVLILFSCGHECLLKQISIIAYNFLTKGCENKMFIFFLLFWGQGTQKCPQKISSSSGF